MSDNKKKAQCIHCFHFFSKDSNSTLKNHISHPHCEALKRVSESGNRLCFENPDVLREQFAGLVIQRGLPLNHFDDEQTIRVFQKHLQPKYNHVSRTTLKRDAIKLWIAAKQAIIDGFANLNTNVNITTDVWSATHGVPGSYICVTAHWIEPSTWQMMKRVIAFEDFSVPHTGSALARTLIKTAFATFDLLCFWKAKESIFLVLSRMTMYIISVQATSVASESAFSTSERVLSIRRTRLTPASLEMCMCLNPIDFEEEILDADVQQNKAILLSEEEIAIDVASSEGTMSGSGSRVEEVDYDMTNYGYDDYE
uniref:HAT C-terminal dimerisation domain-containing protein n=1 Tax=Tanacetum cinerariifolium TaxID=118510 RepID=A0A699GLT0_TANCI|nr:hypothetical protein [Tanacetum cinerariifolium]